MPEVFSRFESCRGHIVRAAQRWFRGLKIGLGPQPVLIPGRLLLIRWPSENLLAACRRLEA